RTGIDGELRRGRAGGRDPILPRCRTVGNLTSRARRHAAPWLRDRTRMISTAALQGSATDKAVETRRFRRAQWRMLLAVMFCYLFYYTGRRTAGFAIPGIHQELGISLATLGWMSTALFWCYALGQFINGSLGDRFGGRRMMTMGAVLSCGFNWITSFGTSIAGLFVPWGANGVAQSMGWAPGGRLLSNWWSAEERGFAFGFYTFAAGLSSVLAFGMSLVVIDVLHLDW